MSFEDGIAFAKFLEREAKILASVPAPLTQGSGTAGATGATAAAGQAAMVTDIKDKLGLVSISMEINNLSQEVLIWSMALDRRLGFTKTPPQIAALQERLRKLSDQLLVEAKRLLAR